MRGAAAVTMLAVLALAGCTDLAPSVGDHTQGFVIAQQYSNGTLLQLRSYFTSAAGSYEEGLRREAARTERLEAPRIALVWENGTRQAYEGLRFFLAQSGLWEARIPETRFESCTFEATRVLVTGEREDASWGCVVSPPWAARLTDLRGYTGYTTFNVTLWQAVDGKVAEQNRLGENANRTMLPLDGVAWEDWAVENHEGLATGPLPERLAPGVYRFRAEEASLRLGVDNFRFRATLADGTRVTHRDTFITLT